MKQLCAFIAVLLLAVSLNAARISGFVKEKSSGEPISSVAVSVKGTNLGQYTNKKGYYVINSVPAGQIEVMASQIGYKVYTTKFTVKGARDDILLNIELEEQDVQIQGAKTVTNEYKVEINTRDIKIGNVTQSTKQLKEVVAVAEADVFRALMALPGVTSISDFSNGLYVRGGSPDQNLILLDGIDVYNPAHFGGLFSTFNTDAVKDVELLKGGYPAIYGGRLSSVLDVTNRDGNRKRHEGIARLSLLSSSATLEGPWEGRGEKGSYMISFRRTYIDLLKKALDLDMPDYYFYDGHAKANWDVSNNNKFSTSFYMGKDVLNFDMGSDFNMEITWGNETFSTQWVHIFNPELFSHFIVAGSHFGSEMDINMGKDHKFERSNDISDLSFKSALSWKPVEEHLIDFGFDLKLNKVDFGAKTTGNEDKNRIPDIQVNSYILAWYAQDSWDLDAFWTIQPGIRLTYCHTESPYLKKKEETDYFRVSPRLSIRRKLSPVSNIYFAFGKYYQYLSLIGDDEASPFDLWFPIDKSLPPGESTHYILGSKIELFERFGIDIETYYKDYKNLVSIREEVDYEWNNETGTLKDALNRGPGYSYGLDIMLRTNFPYLHGFIGYSYSHTKRKIFDTNQNEDGDEQYFYPKYDRTHQVNVVETYNLTEQLDYRVLGGETKIGVTYTYQSGQPYHQPEHITYDPESGFDVLYSYNDRIRLPDYSRFDIAMYLRYEKKSYTIEPYFQIINLFKHQNVWNRKYAAKQKEDGKAIYIDSEDTYMFPRIPFIGVNIEW